MELEGSGVTKHGQDFTVTLRLRANGDGEQWADYDDGHGRLETGLADEQTNMPVTLIYDESGNRMSVLVHGNPVFDLADLEAVRRGGIVRLSPSSDAFRDWHCNLTIAKV